MAGRVVVEPYPLPAAVRARLPGGVLEVPLDEGMKCLADVLEVVDHAYPEIHIQYALIALNGKMASLDAQVGDGDRVMILPNVVGGV